MLLQSYTFATSRKIILWLMWILYGIFSPSHYWTLIVPLSSPSDTIRATGPCQKGDILCIGTKQNKQTNKKLRFAWISSTIVIRWGSSLVIWLSPEFARPFFEWSLNNPCSDFIECLVPVWMRTKQKTDLLQSYSHNLFY